MCERKKEKVLNWWRCSSVLVWSITSLASQEFSSFYRAFSWVCVCVCRYLLPFDDRFYNALRREIHFKRGMTTRAVFFSFFFTEFPFVRRSSLVASTVYIFYIFGWNPLFGGNCETINFPLPSLISHSISLSLSHSCAVTGARTLTLIKFISPPWADSRTRSSLATTPPRLLSARATPFYPHRIYFLLSGGEGV